MGLGTRRRDQLPRWAQDPLWTAARAVPSLDQRFAAERNLVDRISGRQLITFTRATTAQVIGPSGALATAAINEPRFQHDPTTGRCLGLLVEEARTNLLLNSATLSTQGVTVAATAYTLHFTGTGTVTLSGASTAGPLVGTGTGEANRVALTFTPSAGTLTLTVSGSVVNAQLEAGSFRTSYIPTTGTAVARSADIATITGANFSSWYRQDEGTIYTEAVFTSTVASQTGVAALYQAGATTTNRISLRVGNTLITSGGVGSATFTPAASLGAVGRWATAYQTNNFAQSVNGGASAVDTAGASPVSIDELEIGGVEGSASFTLNAPIARLVYWPQRLPNHILQALTR